MSSKDPRYKKVNEALRSAGYTRLPPLWVKNTDLPAIKRLTDKYEKEVNDIRGAVNRYNAGIHQLIEEEKKLELEKSKLQDPLDVDWPGMN